MCVNIRSDVLIAAYPGINWDEYCAMPSRDLTSLALFGRSVFRSASTLLADGDTPSLLNRKPKNSISGTPILHFLGLSVRPHSLNLVTNALNAVLCSLSEHPKMMKSSRMCSLSPYRRCPAQRLYRSSIWCIGVAY